MCLGWFVGLAVSPPKTNAAKESTSSLAQERAPAGAVTKPRLPDSTPVRAQPGTASAVRWDDLPEEEEEAEDQSEDTEESEERAFTLDDLPSD